ncbi:MAG: aminotransferase class IV [Kiloniellaceae bacterium]
MTARPNERIAYFNGEYVPEREVRVPFRDHSFKYGDGVFDMTRTFNGCAFKVKEHVDRLYRSLRYAQIDVGLGPEESMAIWEEVLDRNRHLRGDNGDFWLGQRASRGIDAVGDEGWDDTGPTVIVECLPLPLKARARMFRDGIQVIVPSVRRMPAVSLSPRAKTHIIMPLLMAEFEVRGQNPDAWPILLDQNGNLAEGRGSNIFLVRDHAVFTPREQYVLRGISRQTVIDLARDLDIPVVETDLDLYDAYNADEIFITSTSWCICPVSRFNHVTVSEDRVLGPVTERLIKAYIELVGCDFVQQYLAHLE